MKKFTTGVILLSILGTSFGQTYAEFTLFSSNTSTINTLNTVNLIGRSTMIGSLVSVNEGSTQVCQNVVDANGNWSCSFNGISSGAHTYDFYEGNVLSRSVVVIIGAGTTATDGTTVNSNITIPSTIATNGTTATNVTIPATPIINPPSINSVSIDPSVPLSAWDIIHQTIANQGFTWIGDVANYTNGILTNNPNSATGGLIHNCLADEETKVFRTDTDTENDVVTALAKLAKHCAVSQYGTYFNGKKYTTREEYLMTLLSLFNEGADMNGYFTKYGKYVAYPGLYTWTGFGNVDPTAWFAPVLVKAKELGLIEKDYQWKIAKPLTRIEAMEMLVKMIEFKTGNTLAENSTVVFVDLTQDTDTTMISRNDQDYITVQKAKTVGATSIYESGSTFQKGASVQNNEMVQILSNTLSYFGY